MNNDNANNDQNINNEDPNVINVEEAANELQKKKRGRPKGSKNKPKLVQEIIGTIR